MKLEKMKISYRYLDTLRDTYKVCMGIAKDENVSREVRDMALKEAEEVALSGLKEKKMIKELKEELW